MPRYEYEDIVDDDGNIIWEIDPDDGWVEPDPEPKPDVVVTDPNPRPEPIPGAPGPPPPPSPIPTGPSRPGAPSFPSAPDVPDAPSPNLPVYVKPPAFSYPDYQAPTPWTYQDWAPPTIEEAINSPGYKFRLGQGEEALQHWAAARGTLNDSGTAKALMDYGQNAASQEYGNVWNRGLEQYRTNRGNALDTYNINEGNRFNTYRSNRGNALDTYNTNYQTQYTDPYKFEYQRQSDLFAPQMAEWQTEADFRNQRYATDAAGRLQSQQLSVTDAWNRFLANQNQQNWEKDFGWKVAGGND